MFGNNDDIPAFRWWDKETQTHFVSNHSPDAEKLDRRLRDSGNQGLLAPDGASIGNLLSGGAARSYLTLATVRDPAQGLGRSRSYFSFFLSPYGFVHAIVMGIAEVAKEVWQARRARLAGIEPYLDRGFPYPFLRALTNVVLRPLSTSLVMEEMLRGTPIIYVTYTDYDEIAHHSGPSARRKPGSSRRRRQGHRKPGSRGRRRSPPLRLRDPLRSRADPRRDLQATLWEHAL